MSDDVEDSVKKKIFKLISTPGVEIEEIAKEVELKLETVMKILSDEYIRSDLNQGRRLCCRF